MTADLVREAVERAKSLAEAERRKEADRRLRILSDDWTEILRAEVWRQFSPETRGQISLLLDTSRNVARRVIDTLATLYAYGVSRTVRTSSGEEVDYASVLPDDVDTLFREAQRLTLGLGECGIAVLPDRGRVRLALVPPDAITVGQSAEDPSRLEWLCYEITRPSTGGSDLRRVYWDTYGGHRVYDADWQDITADVLPDNPDGVNPYRDPSQPGRTLIPVVVAHRSPPVWDYWHWTECADLFDGTVMIGVLQTLANYLVKISTVRSLVVRLPSGAKPLPPRLILDPLWPLQISGDGGVEVVDLTTDPRPIAEVIERKELALAASYGLSAEAYRAQVTASSGYALRLQRAELERHRQSQVPLWRGVERELYRVVSVVAAAHGIASLPYDAALTVDYAEDLAESSPEEARRAWREDIALGARSVVDYLRWLDPDLSEDEALAKVERNRRLNAAARNRGVDIDAILERAGIAERGEVE